jgi:hypothetical protein
MRLFNFPVILAAISIATVGCKSEDQPPPQQAGYPQQQTYPQQQPYPAQPAPAAPAAAQPAPAAPAPAAPAPAAPAAPAAAGTMSQPSPMAFPCTTDAQCVTHRCNTPFGKCAWPCQTNDDCTPGNHCAAPACIPGQ